MKVLIIDDEIDLCLLLKSYFRRKGYDVMLSHTLSDGLSQISSFEPDYLFLDNNLPDGIGWPEAPGILTASPGLVLYLISAYHPSVPALPADARYLVMEKPISFADLDKHFETNARQESENIPENT